MKYTIALLLSCTLSSAAIGQMTESERLDRDLEVAAEVLSTLLDHDREDRHLAFFGNDVEVRYVQDMGAIFTLSSGYFNAWSPMVFSTDDHIREGDAVIVHENLARAYSIEEGDDDDEDAEEDRDAEDRIDNFIEAATTLLSDYGALLKKLNPTDKVVIKSQSRNRHRAFAVTSGSFRSKRSLKKDHPERVEISALMSDVLAHDKGSMSEKDFKDAIKISRTKDEPSEREAELDVFSSILYRLFREDYSETYYMDRHPNYDRLADFGVTYHVKVYSSSSDRGRHFIPTLNKRDLTQEERDELVDGLYDDFVQDFKQNVLDYGHTLKTVDEDEAIIFTINLTQCNDCQMPKEIELSIKKSVVTDYRKGNLSLEQAMDKFSFKKIR